MRLMPKGLKSNTENAPLSVARERVRDSWKVLKQSLYYFSLNVKSKSSTTNSDNKGLPYGGESSHHFDLQLKDPQDLSVETLVNQNVKSFLNDSDDYDGIGELLEKYRYELDAFNRLKSKLNHGDMASEFSEISSISELSFSDSDEDTQTIISDFTNADLQTLSNRLSFNDFCPYSSAPDTISWNNKSLSTSSSTLSAKVSPSYQDNSLKLQYKPGNGHDVPPPERARAVLKPLPSLMKPSFIPDIANFDNGDLSNVVKAQASSIACNRRRSSSSKEEEEIRFTKKPVKKADFSGFAGETGATIEIDNSTEDTLENVEFDNITKHFENTLENVEFDNITKHFEEKVEQHGISTPLNINTAAVAFGNNIRPPGINTVQFNSVNKNNCLPFKQFFNKKNMKKKNEVNSDELLFTSYTQHMKNISHSVKCKHIYDSCSKVEPECTTSVDNKHHTISKYISESRIHDIDQQTLNQSLVKPVNISKTTMEKYPHIFSNYLSFQDDPFHSLPNLTTKQEMSSERLLSYDSENFVSKSSLGHSFEASEEVNSNRLNSCYFGDKRTDMDNNFTSADENLEKKISMIDENYFIVYPEMSEETIICGNPPCSKEQIPTEHERAKFTSCPSCFICYCSRTCRHCHWPEHKEACLVGFVNFYVHTFFRRCEKDNYINSYLRNLAYEAYQIFGRGCLMIPFESASDIEYDAISSGSSLTTQPTYKDFKKLISENKSHRHLHMLCQNIKDYDPDQEFVLNIFVCIGNPNMEENIYTAIVRSARISMVKSQKPDYGDSILSYGIRTFSLPTSFQLDMETDVETRRYYCKEIAFGLKRYGVHLKSEYPDAYEKLYRYIDQEVLFTPIILYGKRNERNYKCILYSGKVTKSHEYYGEGAFV